MSDYNPARTREVIATLRALQNNPHVKQIRGTLGSTSKDKRIGAVCALGGIRDFCDSYRGISGFEKQVNLDLPVRTYEITNWNDSRFLSFGQIADKIEEAALANGGEETLYSFLDG